MVCGYQEQDSCEMSKQFFANMCVCVLFVDGFIHEYGGFVIFTCVHVGLEKN